MIIDGKKIAEQLVADLKPKLAPVVGKKFFGAAVVGDDAASMHFLRQKEKTANELDIDFRLYQLPTTITTDDLRQEIGRLAGAKTCGGFIVQLPLPGHLTNKHYILNAIPKEKDVDVLSEASLGAFYSGRNPIVPPAVATVEVILSAIGGSASGGKLEHRDLRELTVAVIGAGFLIGRPIGFYLQSRVAELMVFDSKSKNLHERLRGADIVISGAGVPNLFSAKHLANNTIVIDFGYGRPSTSSGQAGKMCGDFDPSDMPEAISDKQISYTKTPGGTGPILVAELYENFYKLNS